MLLFVGYVGGHTGYVCCAFPLVDYGLYVVCAAITNFYVVFVENLVVRLIFRKIFFDEVQKLSADVCLYVHALRWIKPDNVSLPFVVSALFECTFVD